MKIGFDFDNTIVNYSTAIQAIADESYSIPSNYKKDKMTLKEYLICVQGNDEWTRFQGRLYGPGMRFAEPYVDLLHTLTKIMDKGHEVYIISQRTKHPFLGEKYDLHKEAYLWISKNLKINDSPLVKNENIFFLESRDEKIEKIKEVDCKIFVDDLIEVLNHKNFPKNCEKILFDPMRSTIKFESSAKTISQWKEFLSLI